MKAAPDAREIIVRLLGQPESRGVDGAPDVPGIELIDIVEDPSSVHFDSALSATEMSLEAAAFLMTGYVLVEPGRSGEAMDRTIRWADAGHESVRQLRANFDWLRSVFSTDEVDQRILISPDDLMRELQGIGALHSIFPSLLWRAYRLLADDRKQVEAIVELACVELALELDNGSGGTNFSRSCLYLMAVAAGAITPGKGYHSSLKQVRTKLDEGFKAVRRAHEDRKSSVAGGGTWRPMQFASPRVNTLDTWLRDGAQALGFDPVEWVNGKPPQKRKKS